MTQREFDLTRCKLAWEYHAKRYSYVKIGQLLEVTPRRAESMVVTWEQHSGAQEAHADLMEWRRHLYDPDYRFEPG